MSSTLVPLITSTFTSFPSKQLATSTNSQFISKARTNQTHGFIVSCNASPEDNKNQLILPETQKLILPNNVDRRNLLVGIGGLYTAANMASLPSALASPITVPDITSACKDAGTGFNPEVAIRTGKCCPPSLGKTIQPFVFPRKEKTRMRWPAHKGTDKQVRSYKKAIKAIRDLPDDHPHSFVSQAKIHCAYCNGGYTQVDSGFPDIEIQIHNSWLFFPFHRWYIYFYERILRKHSGDDDFALPYWNWDNPDGMEIPQIFVEENDEEPNPLYDMYRDCLHLPPKVVDLSYNADKLNELDRKTQIAWNLSMVYKDLIGNATNWKGFFGGVYTAGPRLSIMSNLNGAYYGPSIPPPEKKTRAYNRPSRGGGGCNPFSWCFSCICGCIFNLIFQILITILVLLGIAVLVFWLIFRPNAPKFHVNEATLTQFTLSPDNNTLQYNLAVNMTFRNPNKRIGIYYDRIEANAEYHDKRFDTEYLDTFYLGHKKERNVGTVFSGQQIVVLGNGDKSKYDQESRDAVYNIDLKLKLKMRLKVGWAKPKFKPKFECDLRVPLTTGGRVGSSGFQRTKCDFDW